MLFTLSSDREKDCFPLYSDRDELNRWENADNPPWKASRGLISIHVHVKNASDAGLAAETLLVRLRYGERV